MAEKLLNDEIVGQVREIFGNIQGDVSILFFENEGDCDYCEDTRQLLTEVADISEKIDLEIFDLNKDQDVASKYRVDKVPGIVLAGRIGDGLIDYGVRYAGIPSGHEFSSLIHDLIRVSTGDSGLSEKTRANLKELTDPVHMMVFVTPTCPYCPQAVLLAHQLAMESPLVEAEMIEATEFPELSNRYGVSGVPQTTINYGAGTVIGAVPEDHLLSEVFKAGQASG